MKFIYGKQDFNSIERGQENCFLLTNGLGGYSSLTMIGSCARNDHALLMASITAPALRYNMIANTEECICIGEESYELSSQEYVDYTRNKKGYIYLSAFSKAEFPVWDYKLRGISVQKSIVMKRRENTIGIRYKAVNDMNEEAYLTVTPLLQFVQKGERLKEAQKFVTTKEAVFSNELSLYFYTNGEVSIYDTRWQEDYFYSHDARDGRTASGRTAATHDVSFKLSPMSESEFYIIYSMNKGEYDIAALFSEEEERLQRLLKSADIKDRAGQQLIVSSDCFLTERESTGEKTIIAGYPFFADWGRDTMLAVSGIGIVTGRFEETKSIFRSFLRYCKNGLMPNMFPESKNAPLYNTADASLLFICAVYEYYIKSGDKEFIKEAWKQLEDIIFWYKKGTGYHIHMAEDCLIMAGAELEQVTWMDIRYEDILPTPRHGKPVEINAWWYNALKAMEVFSEIIGKDPKEYKALADKVKVSFAEKFWNEELGCLFDTVSGEEYDRQIRCNQIWAVSAPFSILDHEKEKRVTAKVYEHLYTPYGLRTLSPDDAQFKPVYGGSLYERDMAYHQGTVWPFPLGAYYLAYLKINKYNKAAKERVKEQLMPIEACLREGCIGQIAEVYDGLVPGCSKGCFAQAWSVGELLKVYAALERTNEWS